MTRTRIFTAAALATALTVSTALAQQQQPQVQRVSGTIERVDGNTIYGKGPDGARSPSSLPTRWRSPP